MNVLALFLIGVAMGRFLPPLICGGMRQSHLVNVRIGIFGVLIGGFWLPRAFRGPPVASGSIDSAALLIAACTAASLLTATTLLRYWFVRRT
jgi:uncharacterized membrane protein YeaQ/YmgE (transglycosylase-associated protein family)